MRRASVFSAAIACAAALVGGVHSEANAKSVSIAGSYSGVTISPGSNYRPLEINTATLFTLSDIQQGIEVTGNVDFTGLPGNSTVFVGLISKIQYDKWVANDPSAVWFGFLDSAWAGFNTSGDGQAGLGQQQFGDTLQTYVGSGLGTDIAFEALFNDVQMSLTVGANSVAQNYQDHTSYIDGWASVPTDWSQGAYFFVGTWFDQQPPDDGIPTVDVTATAVPTPAAALPAVAMLGALGLRRRRSID